MITILSDEAQGVEAMRVCVQKPRLCEEDGEGETKTEITTPMRMLIEEMPGNIRGGLLDCDIGDQVMAISSSYVYAYRCGRVDNESQHLLLQW